MNKNRLFTFSKFIIGAAMWSIVFILAGMIIESISVLSLSDVLFFEGLIVILVSGIVLIGVVPTWMSIRLLGQSPIQDSAHESTEVEEIERAETEDKIENEEQINISDDGIKEKEDSKRIIKKPRNMFFNLFSLLISGIICIVIAILV